MIDIAAMIRNENSKDDEYQDKHIPNASILNEVRTLWRIVQNHNILAVCSSVKVLLASSTGKTAN